MSFVFDNDRPIYIQLVEQLEIQIVAGQILPGERIPSVRELAQKLQVNPNTMQRALNSLEEQKLIYTQRTNGKFVTDDKKLIEKYKEKYAKEKADNFLNSMQELGFSKEDTINYLIKIGGKK